MKNNLVSIIVPTYNGEKHLAATLESLIAQDYENLEIILVNDASTDSTAKIAKKILSSSTRNFQFIERSQNGGQCPARNTGLKHANGDYIIFFDHDDLAEKNFVSSLLREAESNNADLVFCGIKHFHEEENKFDSESINLEKKFFNFNPEDYLKAWATRKLNLWSVWNFIFRKSFIDKINLRFNEQCMLGEDTEFIIKAMAAAEKISFVNENLYIYVHHSGMTYVKYKSDRKVFDTLALARYRSIRPVIRRFDNKKIRNYAVNFYVADAIVKRLTYCATCKAPGDYEKMQRILKHKKVRKLLFSTVKFSLRKPELFFKALMLLYMPRLYYFAR